MTVLGSIFKHVVILQAGLDTVLAGVDDLIQRGHKTESEKLCAHMTIGQ